MKIYRDGKYFAIGDSLEDMASVAEEDVSRYSFDLEDLKTKRKEKVATDALEELSSLFEPGRGLEESIGLIAAHVEALCDAVGAPVDPRLTAVSDAGKQAQAKKQAINAAQSDADLEAIA